MRPEVAKVYAKKPRRNHGSREKKKRETERDAQDDIAILKEDAQFLFKDYPKGRLLSAYDLATNDNTEATGRVRWLRKK
jgi:hypothetical protein